MSEVTGLKMSAEIKSGGGGGERKRDTVKADNKWACKKESETERVARRENKKKRGDKCNEKVIQRQRENETRGRFSEIIGENQDSTRSTDRERKWEKVILLLFQELVEQCQNFLSPTLFLRSCCQQQRRLDHYRSTKKCSTFHSLQMKSAYLCDLLSISWWKYMQRHSGVKTMLIITCALFGGWLKFFFFFFKVIFTLLISWLDLYLTDSVYSKFYHLLLHNGCTVQMQTMQMQPETYCQATSMHLWSISGRETSWRWTQPANQMLFSLKCYVSNSLIVLYRTETWWAVRSTT